MCRIPQRSFCLMDSNMTKIKHPLIGNYNNHNMTYEFVEIETYHCNTDVWKELPAVHILRSRSKMPTIFHLDRYLQLGPTSDKGIWEGRVLYFSCFCIFMQNLMGRLKVGPRGDSTEYPTSWFIDIVRLRRIEYTCTISDNYFRTFYLF